LHSSQIEINELFKQNFQDFWTEDLKKMYSRQEKNWTHFSHNLSPFGLSDWRVSWVFLHTFSAKVWSWGVLYSTGNDVFFVFENVNKLDNNNNNNRHDNSNNWMEDTEVRRALSFLHVKKTLLILLHNCSIYFIFNK
jgi:hypothetical protein